MNRIALAFMLAEPAAELDTIHRGHHPIEDGHLRRVNLLQDIPGVEPIFDRSNAIVPLLQPVLEHVHARRGWRDGPACAVQRTLPARKRGPLRWTAADVPRSGAGLARQVAARRDRRSNHATG